MENLIDAVMSGFAVSGVCAVIFVMFSALCWWVTSDQRNQIEANRREIKKLKKMLKEALEKKLVELKKEEQKPADSIGVLNHNL